MSPLNVVDNEDSLEGRTLKYWILSSRAYKKVHGIVLTCEAVVEINTIKNNLSYDRPLYLSVSNLQSKIVKNTRKTVN